MARRFVSLAQVAKSTVPDRQMDRLRRSGHFVCLLMPATLPVMANIKLFACRHIDQADLKNITRPLTFVPRNQTLKMILIYPIHNIFFCEEQILGGTKSLKRYLRLLVV